MMRKAAIHKVYKIQAFLGTSCVLILAFFSPIQALSFLVGVLIITLNFYLLNMVWQRVFDKKSVATTMLLIITKYAALAILLYVFVSKVSNHLVAFFAGITTIVASLMILALQIYLKEKK